MNENLSAYSLRDVATAIPSTVPSAGTEDKFRGWDHGACRQSTLPDGRSVGFYRQAVRNKYTQQVKYFAVSIPLDFYGEIEPGQSLNITKGMLGIETAEEIAEMARESFLKLQELVVEWHNREVA
jgi:hypothetical protein